jgi:tellurite resistance protein
MNPLDLVKAVLEFFKGQPFSNVVAFMQLGLLSAAIWVAMYQVVPSERAAILDGVKHQEEQQTQQVNRITESFEKALDRIDRRPFASRE